MKRAAILQSAYIPWRGYFDLIAAVDEFVFYDDVQFSNGDWRNRNRILTTSGPKWLTIPVPKKGRIRQNIQDIHAIGSEWRTDHWNRIAASYSKARYFDEVSDLLWPIYQMPNTRLSEVNHALTSAINGYLGIRTRLSWSTDYDLPTGRSERLVEICHMLDCKTYVSGPAAKSYLDISAFESRKIAVEWFGYDKLKPYRQLHGTYEPNLSIIDLLFNHGPQSKDFLPSLHLG